MPLGAALSIGAVVVLLAGGRPGAALAGLWQGSFGSPAALAETAARAVPCVLGGLAVAVAFRAGLFNIGAEGQLALGSLAAAWLGYGLPAAVGDLPRLVHLPLVLAGGMLAGGLWGAIPGWLKARTGGHEVINTIMMNYVALLGAGFLLNGPMRDPDPANVIARTPEIATSARLPLVFEGTGLHWGAAATVAAPVLLWWALRRTALGLELRAVGAAPEAARHAGVGVDRVVVGVMALSGALAGLAGALEVAGTHHRHELGFSLGYGFEAIAVALLARAHPLGVLPAGLLIAALRTGAPAMQFLTQLPSDLIPLLEGVLILAAAWPVRGRGRRAEAAR